MDSVRRRVLKNYRARVAPKFPLTARSGFTSLGIPSDRRPQTSADFVNDSTRGEEEFRNLYILYLYEKLRRLPHSKCLKNKYQ